MENNYGVGLYQDGVFYFTNPGLVKTRTPEGDETFDGGKEYIVKRIFEGYKKLAYANMLQKYPEVRKEIEKSQGYKYEMLTPLKAGEKQVPKGLE